MFAHNPAHPHAFGTRRFPPPLFTPVPPESPLRAFIEPRLEKLKAEIEHAGILARARFEEFRIRALAPRPPKPKTITLAKPAAFVAKPAPIVARQPIHPALRSVALESRETFVRVLAYVAGIGALAFAAAQILQSPPVEAAVDTARRPEWITVDKPRAAFALAMPEFGDDVRYAIRRNIDGGGRKDIMTFGEPGRSLRYASVEIYRPGTEIDQFSNVASEIALRAGDSGRAGAVRPSMPINSKFGAVPAVEFSVGHFGIGHCVGLARAFDQPRLQISGVFCSMDALVDRSGVACALDRLTLMSAGSDPDIAKLFADAELKRNFCGQRDIILAATPKRLTQNRADSTLRLRGRLPGR